MPFTYPLQRYWYLLAFGCLLVAVGITEHLITQSAVFPRVALLPGAVAFDLVVLVPLFFYLLVIKPYRLSLTTLGGAVSACLAFTFWLIPIPQQKSLWMLQFLPVAVETLALAMLVVKARKFNYAYQTARTQDRAVWPSVRIALPAALGKVGSLLVAELEMLRYALTGWWLAAEVEKEAKSFTNYRESGFMAFIAMLTVIIFVEATVVHLLVMCWQPDLAKWFLLADVYTLAFVVAHAHAVRLRPALVYANQSLLVRIGILWELSVAKQQLLTVESLRDTPAADAGIFNLSKHLFTPPNLLLTFGHPVEIIGPFGLSRTARQVAIYVDKPQEFKLSVTSCSLSVFKQPID